MFWEVKAPLGEPNSLSWQLHDRIEINGYLGDTWRHIPPKRSPGLNASFGFLALRQGATDLDITHVFVSVKPGQEEANCYPYEISHGVISSSQCEISFTWRNFLLEQEFKKATRENAMQSVRASSGSNERIEVGRPSPLT